MWAENADGREAEGISGKKQGQGQGTYVEQYQIELGNLETSLFQLR